MDNTLDPIPANRNQDSNLSFIYGRDPSILAYGQIVHPHEESKKNLESLFEADETVSRGSGSSIPSLSSLGDTIKVYLRLRPFPQKLKLSQQQQEAYQIISANTLLTKLPSLDSNSSSLKRPKGSGTVSRQFTFTNTFGPETTQLQLFEQAVKQQMNQFLNGQSATVMSYGTTNAGKSYTLQGTTASPGIIPRGLEFVFCNINPRATPCYKPVYNKDVVSLDANARAYEMELKTKLLSFGSIDKNHYIQAYRSMQQLLRDESPLKENETTDANYSVWVSFAEIYNETIFDLLSNDCQKKRPPLKLATDSGGKAFIKDLKMICVNSGSEAYQLLMAGQYNLKVAATALNARSSRSHCIFTIKLLKYYKENSPADVEVSTFSFCDLAGSERLKKTLNAGERLKEAQNINTSLMVLGRCLKSIYEVQSSKLKHEVIGPFRESKLTRLFQSALSGKEYIALIVNVNPVPNLYIETQNVLNFSAIAKQIVIEPVTRKRRASHSRFSQLVSQSVTTVTDWDATDLESIGEEESCRVTENADYIHVEEYDEVIKENEKLKKEVLALKNAALTSDFEIRQEMSNIYTAMIRDLETNFKNRLQDVEEQQEDMLEWSVKQVEDYYKDKLSKLTNRKRSRIDNGDETDDEINIEELESENAQLTAKVESLKKSVQEMRESKEKITIENNKNVFELSLVKKDLENCRNLLEAAQKDIGGGGEAKTVVDELQKQLSAREDQIKSLKKYLNEAKEEFLRIQKTEAELEECLKNKNQQLLESSEKITDLTEQIEQSNVCLAESTKTVETLEDKLDSYARKLETVEENLQTMEDKWSKAVANNLVVAKENEELKKMLDVQISNSKIAAEKCACVEQVSILQKLNDDLSQLKAEAEESKAAIATKDENLETLNAKFSESQNENVSLKLQLARSIENTKLLRKELNLTQDSLGDITQQINSLKEAEATKKATVNTDSQTSFVSNDEILEADNLVCIKEEIIEHEEEEATTDNENDDNHRGISSNQIESKTQNDNNNRSEDSEKLAELTTEYNELKTKFLESDLRVEELSKQLKEAKAEVLSVKASYDLGEKKIREYEDSLESFNNKLRLSESELSKNNEKLDNEKRERQILENKIFESERIVERLEKELEESQNRNEKNSELLEESLKKMASVEQELSTTVETVRSMATKCSTEHTNNVTKLEKEIAAAKERDVIKEQLLDAHMQRITKLEKDLTEVTDLRDKLKDFENSLKIREEEKLSLEKQLEENQDKISTLEKELQASISREEEKENETVSLQKAMKNLIQNNNTKKDTEMETEVKNTLRELTAARKALSESEAALKMHEKISKEKIERLEMRVQTYEKNASYLAMLQEGAEKREAESEQLRISNNELKREIEQNKQEMISFNKNRDATIQRYETLVKQLQEEVERTKREVLRYQELFLRQATPTPHKEEVRKLKDELRSKTSLLEQMQDQIKKSASIRDEKEEVVDSSADETLPLEIRRTRRRARIPANHAANDVSIIELSGSESKRVTRRTALPPPSTAPSVEKRKTRKKKLFANVDDNCVDVEQIEHTPKHITKSPLTETRSLRARRK